MGQCQILVSTFKSRIKRGIFGKIICFEQSDFQPALTHSFIMDIGLSSFVYDRMKMGLILREHQELGAHTKVVQLEKEKTSTFMWTHPGARPMGELVANQCGNCRRLKTTSPTVSQDKKSIVIKCAVCYNTKTYALPSGWTWVFGPPVKGDERGAWLFPVDAGEDVSLMDTT